MLEVYQRLGLNIDKIATVIVILNYEQRERGRMRLIGTKGEEVGLFLERGQALLVNEYLQSDCGQLIKIEGALEPVAVGQCSDWQTFAKACYHLGNRHVKVQVKDLTLVIQPDHVLEEMLVLQGLTISYQQAVFLPESGAYQKNQHAH